MDERTEERLAANEASFRDANERIRDRAEELEFEPPVPFLCECGEPSCTAIVRLAIDEYEAIRSHRRRFFVAAEHEHAAARTGRVVERRDRYAVVEKTGAAGDVAAASDRREPSPQR